MKRVLITGANGMIGTLLRERLAERYELVGLTRRPADFPSRISDITDLASLLPTFAGIDAVVHMAGEPSPAATWDETLSGNVIGTYNVLEACRRNGVGAVVYASSNHALGWWEVEQGPGIYDPDDPRVLDEQAQFRPDSFYGWSKAAAETLGRFYSDAHGIRFCSLRIGWVLSSDDPLSVEASEGIPPISRSEARNRLGAIWLSHRDCAELVRCSLDAEYVRYGVYYGVSNNRRRFYDLANARDELGYVPQDSAPF